MSMFCYQCEEADKNIGCELSGICGKKPELSNMMDLLMYVTKGVAIYAHEARKLNITDENADYFVYRALFLTITNANFDDERIKDAIEEGLRVRGQIKEKFEAAGGQLDANPHESTYWKAERSAFDEKANSKEVGVLATQDEDVRSLRELLIYGMKGIAAYAEHAHHLGETNDDIFAFMERGLAATTDDSLSADDLVNLVMECGKYGVEVMSLLDKANTSAYGHPEMTQVNLGVRNNPGILISGHDMKDMEELLKQTEGTGVDVYTHSEMLPANYYPAFKKYGHFVGNYGNSWWMQDKEFKTFNGPILMTTNCITPPRKSYKDRVYTTGAAGFEGVKHIGERKNGSPKDFSAIIEHAKQCEAPEELETGQLVGGFAHNQVMQLADKVVDAVKSGAIKKFFVMAGCDGRFKERNYYRDFADALPEDTVILTAGCAKYRYNKLNLGDIGGIPRVLDAGQCNDSYSLAMIALKLKEVFELDDLNDLPIEYNIAWYEQKAVIVLLSLLYLGVKDIKLGPKLPAFLSPNVANVLVDKFGISGISTVEEDLKAFDVA